MRQSIIESQANQLLTRLLEYSSSDNYIPDLVYFLRKHGVKVVAKHIYHSVKGDTVKLLLHGATDVEAFATPLGKGYSWSIKQAGKETAIGSGSVEGRLPMILLAAAMQEQAPPASN